MGRRMIINVQTVETVIHRQVRQQQTRCLGKPDASEFDCEKPLQWPLSIVEPEDVK